MAAYVAENAVIDPRAELADEVEVGPFCVIGPKVVIGRGTKLENNVTIMGRVTIGEHNHVFPGTVIGGEPQDLSYQGSDTQVIIGNHNVFRECVTINRASEKEEGVTQVGSHCYFMAGMHVAHDCRIGDRVVIANGSMLAGHVHVHSHATISGAVGVHQFSTIGSYCFVGAVSKVLQDVPPYMLADGLPARPRCINVVALKRNDFPAEDVKALAEAHRLIYRAKVGLDHAREILRSNDMLIPSVNHLLTFIQGQQEGRHGRARERRREAA